MAISKARLIESALRAAAGQDWALSIDSTASGWRLSRDGSILFANVDQHWLYLCMPLATDPAAQPPVDLRRFARLCHRMFMAKYSLDAAGQLLLRTEIPLADADHEYCRQAIEAMMVYRDRHDAAPPIRATVTPHTNHASATGGATASAEPEIVPAETWGLCIQSIAHLGWGMKEKIGANRWHAAYRGRERPFDVYLCANEAWVCVQLSMADSSIGEDAGTEGTGAKILLTRYLLRLNDTMCWAKVGMNERDQMALMIEVPVGLFDVRRFRRVARTVAAYADQYARDLQVAAALSKDRHLSQLLLAASHGEPPQ
ncbi:MAG: hypothetical protein HN849_32490 [Victivallales bacterium]|jgi:hypothetical protein|nr:hypothetical protein [Victivallales bacterium]